jgi:serine phosphatase RsbU (regulator of sigma subunit)
MGSPLLAALHGLLEASHHAAPDDLPALVDAAAIELGAQHGLIYLVDYDQAMLIPFVGDTGGGNAAEPVSIESTIAGRTFADVSQHVATSEDSRAVWTPLLDGTERLGVTQILFPASTEIDEALLSACHDVTALLAELVMTRAEYGDAVQRLRRQRGLTVPAELQWRLLPPLTFLSPRVGIAGALQPAEEVAGDSFDYAVNGDTAHVAIFDAMGHGLEAALLAAVAVPTLRNARRSHLDLASTVEAIDATIAGAFGSDKFVTGVVGELDTATGWWRWINCGHPPTLIVRDGHVVKTLDNPIGPPLGFASLSGESELGQERLQQGDRLLLYTDGVIEARDAAGNFFGTGRLVEFVSREAADGRPIAETLRRLNRAILAHQEERLQDDATTVVVEWMTPQS